MITIFGGLSLLAFTGKFSKKQIKVLTYTALIVFAFIYEPSPKADMYRFHESILFMKRFGSDAAYERLSYIYENSQAFFVIMKIFSYLPISLFFPVALLSTYGVLLAIFFDFTDNFELTKHQFAMIYSFFLCCLNFGIVFSIMRYFIAYCIGIAGIYIWFRKGTGFLGRAFSLFMIIVPTYIHASGFIILLMWLLIIFYHIKSVRILSVFIPFLMAFSEKVISITDRFFRSIPLYRFIVDKFLRYSEENFVDMFNRTRLFSYQLLAFIVISFIVIKISKYENKKYIAFNIMYMLVLLFTIAYVPNNTMFFRMFQILIAMTPMYFAENNAVFSKSNGMQLFMLAECVTMLCFYGRFSTYFYL
ncbi:MAG: hypothetical protein IJE46_04005 [Clostridia bacterium]|nr:hypothetical protein [Clostridia bacterium]